MNNTVTLVSLKSVSRGQSGLNKVSESKKNGHLAACFPSYYLLAWINKKTNNREACYFQRKKDKNLHAISKEQRTNHILLVINLHFSNYSAIVDIIK